MQRRWVIDGPFLYYLAVWRVGTCASLSNGTSQENERGERGFQTHKRRYQSGKLATARLFLSPSVLEPRPAHLPSVATAAAVRVLLRRGVRRVLRRPGVLPRPLRPAAAGRRPTVARRLGRRVGTWSSPGWRARVKLRGRRVEALGHAPRHAQRRRARRHRARPPRLLVQGELRLLLLLLLLLLLVRLLVRLRLLRGRGRGSGVAHGVLPHGVLSHRKMFHGVLYHGVLPRELRQVGLLGLVLGVEQIPGRHVGGVLDLGRSVLLSHAQHLLLHRLVGRRGLSSSALQLGGSCTRAPPLQVFEAGDHVGFLASPSGSLVVELCQLHQVCLFFLGCHRPVLRERELQHVTGLTNHVLGSSKRVCKLVDGLPLPEHSCSAEARVVKGEADRSRVVINEESKGPVGRRKRHNEVGLVVEDFLQMAVCSSSTSHREINGAVEHEL